MDQPQKEWPGNRWEREAVFGGAVEVRHVDWRAGAAGGNASFFARVTGVTPSVSARGARWRDAERGWGTADPDVGAPILLQRASAR